MSGKITSKWLRPLRIARLISNNAVEIEVQDHLKIQNAINELRTAQYDEQPSNIGALAPITPDPVPAFDVDDFDVESILNPKKKGRGDISLTHVKDAPTHDAKWKQRKRFCW